jgi:hypothetical protein
MIADDKSAPRPLGATLLALLLGWLAVGGFGNAFVWRTLPAAFDEPLPTRLAVFIELLQSPVLSVISFMYGVTAVVAAIGIWWLRPWMRIAFLSWSAFVVAQGVYLATQMPLALVQVPRGALYAMSLLVVAIVAPLYFYVAKLAARRGPM